MNTVRADVVFDRVHVRYRHLPALEDISFTIAAGSFWGIIGPNGSGKSTLVKTLLGLVRPSAGTVLTLGKAPHRLGRLRDHIGYVPQYAEMDFSFPLRVIDVVTMGLYGKIGLLRRVTSSHRDIAMQALRKVEAENLAQRHVSELSGGQRQRMLIARALVLEPTLLILDEPTAALDHSAADGLYAWLHEHHEREGGTIILVSHDIGVVSSYVDNIACLNRRLVAHGRPDDVFTAPTMESMYGCGAALFDHGHIPHMVVSHDHGEAAVDTAAAQDTPREGMSVQAAPTKHQVDAQPAAKSDAGDDAQGAAEAGRASRDEEEVQ